MKAKLSFERNQWTGNADRPRCDMVFLTVGDWCYPRVIYGDDTSQEAIYWRSVMEREEGT